MYILASMWFTKLIKQFFFWIDKIVFNFISTIYDLMITIARTSPLSQSDILDMADRIYKLLAVFMIFKVTLSLITYVVNPDDFSDKTKGISKLGTNIIISLSLLILTPYIFNYAYQFQTIILEDNTLATLIFGDNTEKQSFFNSAGDDMAYLTFSAFLTPNLSLGDLYQCTTLIENGKINPNCEEALRAQDTESDNFSPTTLENYIVAIENNSLGMLLRQDLVTATNKDNEEFIMDYKFIFSTIVGIIVILLLLSFCMDVAVRSIKLAFLQLIAPIPIISYVDPKSGKDGMFKKWYQMCFKTFLSLFVRLLALYFSVYIISMVASHGLVDIIDGSSQTNAIVKIFIIIGALMFAKQFPKILEGLGIKLDGDSKFTLNPLKKLEEGAVGGKRITGAARGFAVGAAGALSGAGAGRAFSGAFRGFTGGKGWKETGKAEAEMNRKMRQAKLDGSTFRGRMGAKFAGAVGLPSQSESISGKIHEIDEKKKAIDNELKPYQTRINDRKAIAEKIGSMEDRAVKKIKDGEAGAISVQYKSMVSYAENLQKRLEAGDTSVTEQDVARAQNMAHDYLMNAGKNDFIDVTTGRKTEIGIYDSKGVSLGTRKMTDIAESERFKDATMQTLNRDLMAMAPKEGKETYVTTYTDENGIEQTRTVEISKEILSKDTEDLHGIMGNLRGSMADDTRKYISPKEAEKTKLDEEKAKLYEEERKAKANESAIK